MAPPETLNEMDHLERSSFGKPHPRHGLKLLYWFAHDCVSFYDNQPYMNCDPSNGKFGFHVYNNHEDLLPDQDNPYYEVGNLHSAQASELPKYVRKNRDINHDDSNVDRIIICLDDDDDERLERIYVTRHQRRQTRFDPQHTYRISKGLLKIIHNLEDRNEFLRDMGYVEVLRQAEQPDPHEPSARNCHIL